MTTLNARTECLVNKKLQIFLVSWLYLIAKILSECLTNNQLTSYGFTPMAQTEVFNGTYCNRLWTNFSLCIKSKEEFETVMNKEFNATNIRRMELITSMKENFEVLRTNLDQLFRNDTSGVYANCSALISPIDPKEFFTIFKKSYSNCFDNLNLIQLNWMCKLVTTNATNHLVNGTLLALPQIAYLYQMSCVPVLRVYCMYLKYFEYVSKTRNEYGSFLNAVSETTLRVCNDTLVVCDNNYSNIRCLQSYKNLLVDRFFDLGGLKNELELRQMISYYFEKGPRPKFYDTNNTELHPLNIIIDEQNGTTFSAVSVKGIISKYSSVSIFAILAHSLLFTLLLL